MTNTPWAPWIVVEGTDDRYRSLTVGRIILDALTNKLADVRDQNFPVAPPMTLEAASNAVYERTRATYTIKGFQKGEADRAHRSRLTAASTPSGTMPSTT